MEKYLFFAIVVLCLIEIFYTPLRHETYGRGGGKGVQPLAQSVNANRILPRVNIRCINAINPELKSQYDEAYNDITIRMMTDGYSDRVKEKLKNKYQNHPCAVKLFELITNNLRH